MTQRKKMKNTYEITVYIPKANCETVKEAMFKAGAGQIDAYEESMVMEKEYLRIVHGG